MEAVKEKKKVAVITEQEFKEIFSLEEGYKINKTTLKQYTNYLKGAYLMHQELLNIHEKKFSMSFMGKRYKLRARFDGTYGGHVQSWVDSLGSKPKIEVYYFHKGRDEFYPFWAQGDVFDKFGEDTDYLHNAIYLAYEMFTSNVLLKIKSKYQGKYKVNLEYRNIGKDTYRGSYKYASDMMKPIWLDGASFMIDLEVMRPDKTHEYIKSYRVAQSIHNRENIWTGEMLPPVKRIIDSLKNSY